MATTEHTINDALAELLRGTRRAWRDSKIVSSENTGQLKGTSGRPQTMPILDVTALSAKQLAKAVKVFDEMCYKQMLPIHEIGKDPVRNELDARFGREVLGLPESMLQPGGALDVLRMKLAQEPSIRGNK